jgi:hypothetical protein
VRSFGLLPLLRRRLVGDAVSSCVCVSIMGGCEGTYLDRRAGQIRLLG